ncbi:MAG: ABC transporter substrate-binding protein [Caldilinea sp.]
MKSAEQGKAPGGRKLTRREFLRYTAVGSSAAIFLSACAPATAPTGGVAPTSVAGEAPAAGAPKQGGTMVWLGHQEVAGLSPDDNGPDVQAVLVYNIHNPLLYYNEFNELELVLADSYEVSDDGLTYTFKLKEGVKFHDGADFTAKDVAYTYDYYRNPDNGAVNVGDFTNVESVEAPDDYTVVVNMSDINAASLSTWATTAIVQSTYHAEVGEATYRTAPIGTGAYKLKEWRAAEFTELEAFEDHFRGRPNIDVIRLEVVPEPSVRTIALQTGDADATVWPLLVEDTLALAQDPNFVVLSALGNSIKHFPLNNSLPQLSDKRVRQAMMHALNRDQIVADLWQGAASVAHSNIPPSSFFYNDMLKQYPYDLDAARALLDEAGWVPGADGIREKDGARLAFTMTTITGDQARRPIAEFAQLQLKEVGVDVQLAEAPVASILEGMRAGTVDSSIFNWTYNTDATEPDPFSTLHSMGGNNFNQFKNEEMDSLIEEGLTTVDPAARKQIYDRVQEIFVEEAPCLFLQFDEWLNVFSSRIKGLPVEPKASTRWFYRANEWWLE